MKTKFFHHDSMIVTIFAKFFNSLLIQSNLLQLIESVMSVENKIVKQEMQFEDHDTSCDQKHCKS